MKYILPALIAASTVYASPVLQSSAALIPTVSDLGGLSGEIFSVPKDRHHITLQSGTGNLSPSAPNPNPSLDIPILLTKLKLVAESLGLSPTTPVAEVNAELGKLQSGPSGMGDLSGLVAIFASLSKALETVKLPSSPTLGDVYEGLETLRAGEKKDARRVVSERAADLSGLAGVPGASDVLAGLTQLDSIFELDHALHLSDLLSFLSTIDIIKNLGLPTLPDLPDAKKLFDSLTALDLEPDLEFGQLLDMLQTSA